MPDIVDKLRNRDAVVMAGMFYAVPTMLEAAAEIERLRAALQQFVDMPEKFPEESWLDGFSQMRAAFANAKAVLQPPT